MNTLKPPMRFQYSLLVAIYSLVATCILLVSSSSIAATASTSDHYYRDNNVIDQAAYQLPSSSLPPIVTPFETATPSPFPAPPQSPLALMQTTPRGTFTSQSLTRRSTSSSSRSTSNLFERRTPAFQHPQMFADSPTAGLSLEMDTTRTVSFAGRLLSDAPLGAGVRRLRVAANNRALPQDRILFDYQIYTNGLSANRRLFFNNNPELNKTIDLQQYTIGMEKTFAYGLASVDIRTSVANEFSFNNGFFGVHGGSVGNINTKLKYLLYSNDDSALSVGLGIEAPTGSNLDLRVFSNAYELRNSAWFLQPFLAYEERFDKWFLNSFLSTDLALNGNELRRIVSPIPNFGKVNDQSLLIWNIGGGRWLWSPSFNRKSGLAAALELNYATTLNDRDVINSDRPQPFLPFDVVTIQATTNRSDTLNLGTGLHYTRGNLQIRGGFVQPLRSGDDRTFSHEAIFQTNWHF